MKKIQRGGKDKKAAEDHKTEAKVDKDQEEPMQPEQQTEQEPTPEPESTSADTDTDTEDNSKADAETDTEKPAISETPNKPKGHGFKYFWTTSKGKATLALLIVVLIAVILLVVPFTRYGILGKFVKKDVTVQLTDSTTKKPVTQATVKIDGDIQAKTDSTGQAKFKKVSAGNHTLSATKKYFNSTSEKFTVGLSDSKKSVSLKLKATGRQVPISVVNTITGKPIKGAIVSVLGTSSATDEDGKAVIVIPANKTQTEGTVKLSGYNTKNITLTVTEQASDSNEFTLTPSGKIYFLSKRTGVINVMKSNLDGTDSTVVIQGTGQEEEGDTQLLATRDWHYLALKSRRDSKNAKLYLIDTTNDNMTVIDDEGADENTYISPVGWYNNRLIFTVYNYDIHQWQPNRISLKSFDATNSSTALLDQNQGVGTSGNDYATENFGDIHVLNDQIVYAKNWYGNKYVNGYSVYQPLLDGKKATITYIKPDGSGRHNLKEYTFSSNSGASIDSMAHKTEEVWFQVTDRISGANTYFKYTNGNLNQANDLNQALFYRPITTYLVSPSSAYSFWYESRDGKNSLFTGNQAGDDGTQIASGTEYFPFGWYTDDYLLVSKKGSELYITGRGGPVENAVKITDYHKPNYTYPGHGYSYGWYY